MEAINKVDKYIKNSKFNLDQVIDDYTPYIKTIIHNMANGLSYEDKEEILSDTFFVLWKNRKKEILNLDLYLAGITRNLIKEKLRKHRINYDLSEFEDSLEYNNIDLYSNERAFIEELRDTFKISNSIDLEILNMFYFYSIPTKSIAKKLNISEINVRSKLFRMRKKIKKILNMEDNRNE